jgi:hypothetical protein
MANTLDKLNKLAKRYFLPVATILDYYYKEIIIYKI